MPVGSSPGSWLPWAIGAWSEQHDCGCVLFGPEEPPGLWAAASLYRWGNRPRVQPSNRGHKAGRSRGGLSLGLCISGLFFTFLFLLSLSFILGTKCSTGLSYLISQDLALAVIIIPDLEGERWERLSLAPGGSRALELFLFRSQQPVKLCTSK